MSVHYEVVAGTADPKTTLDPTEHPGEHNFKENKKGGGRRERERDTETRGNELLQISRA